MSKQLEDKYLKPYNPAETEALTYDAWEKSGYFNPDVCVKNKVTDPKAESFSIVLPPPNVTGTLHMGHAAMLAIEDIMIRYARMRGKKTLWIPGTDHAAIATQTKVEKIIQKEEGKRRHDLGREEFLNRVNKFASESHDTIVHQVRKMGCSIDWSREAYTLDEKRNLAVRTAFKAMYDDGLIFRKNKVVNWDPKGQTVISDDEVIHEEAESALYTFKYSKDFPIEIATTRPETKIGDTAVAVNPTDERYKKYIGQTFDVNFCGVPLKIKVIGEDTVDMAFGTGAVGVTPAHSMVDYEMAERHKLPLIQVIDEFGKIMVENPELKGKKTLEARTIIVEWLKKENLLIKEEKIKNNISKAERSGGVIEPLPKLQWFISVDKKFKIKNSKLKNIKDGQEVSLKELMISVVQNGEIEVLPERFGKEYFHWINNLHDWCISRQIWFGHRIPVWYKGTELYCDIEAPKGADWKQDEDTLDTWFSSGLWTFSTLGWPNKDSVDLKTFHPTSVLETGYDILFFWVARMILMTTYHMGEVPFKTVYLHGIVRNADGSKMSKSSGKVIDPLDMIEKYGADATRLSLIIGTGPGNDFRISEDKIKSYKHFANKLWNITRFIYTNTLDTKFDAKFDKYSPADIELRNARHTLMEEITKEMNEHKFYLVGEKLYHYAWHELADKILEESKKVIAEGTKEEAESRKQFLLHTLDKLLRSLHPFMPYITEEIWKTFPRSDKKEFLMIENWPILG